MKQLITFSPAFTPTDPTSGTPGMLDFSAYSDFNLGKLYAVINLTKNTPIYIPGSVQYGFGGYANTGTGKVIYLSANTATHSSNDELEVFYDTSTAIVDSNQPMERGGNLEDISNQLKAILVELRVMNYTMQQGLYPLTFDDVDRLRTDLTAYDYNFGDKAT